MTRHTSWPSLQKSSFKYPLDMTAAIEGDIPMLPSYMHQIDAFRCSPVPKLLSHTMDQYSVLTTTRSFPMLLVTAVCFSWCCTRLLVCFRTIIGYQESSLMLELRSVLMTEKPFHFEGGNWTCHNQPVLHSSTPELRSGDHDMGTLERMRRSVQVGCCCYYFLDRIVRVIELSGRFHQRGFIRCGEASMDFYKHQSHHLQ